ncbi:MAG: signal peptidase I [Clostridia bacterium]|nr:signal peptidase I [Clostridia bacterium]
MLPLVFSILWDVLLGILIALCIRLFVGHLSRVEGGSMLPTLQSKDWVLVLRLPYLFRRPRRQEVVICHYPNRRMKKCPLLHQHFIKRVAGLPGDLFEITGGTVHIDGHPLAEPYLAPEQCRFKRSKPLRRLGRQDFYVLGDNRDHSNDSRSVGPIRRKAIRGRAVCIIWPPKRWQKLR